MKAAELKCQNLIVKKVCQVEHFKTFRKAIGPELGLYILFPFADPFPFLFSLNLSLVVESSAHLTDLTYLTLISKILHEDYNYKDWTTYWPSHFSNIYEKKQVFNLKKKPKIIIKRFVEKNTFRMHETDR